LAVGGRRSGTLTHIKILQPLRRCDGVVGALRRPSLMLDVLATNWSNSGTFCDLSAAPSNNKCTEKVAMPFGLPGLLSLPGRLPRCFFWAMLSL